MPCPLPRESVLPVPNGPSLRYDEMRVSEPGLFGSFQWLLGPPQHELWIDQLVCETEKRLLRMKLQLRGPGLGAHALLNEGEHGWRRTLAHDVAR